MGDGIAGHISKGPVHQLVDACLNHQAAGGQFDKRAAFLTGLQAATTSVQYRALIEQQAGVSPKMSVYLSEVWYNETGAGNWQNLQPIYPVLREGLIKAITLAGNNLLVDSYWLPLPNLPFVEVILMRSARQVTRLIMTPTSAVGTPRTADTEMWVIAQRASAQEIVNFTTGDQRVEAVTAGANPVVTWRRREHAAGQTGA
jgi:hypothetical protein